MNITLVGMFGAGKSKIGKVVADLLGYDHIDTDVFMVEELNVPLQQIVNEMGEEAFLDYESGAILRAIEGRDNTVLSPGGSVIYCDEAMEYVREYTKVVFLDVPFTQIEERVRRKPRPIIGQGDDSLLALYLKRTPLYQRWAHITVDGVGKKQEVAGRVIEALSLSWLLDQVQKKR